jgi:hypothetical protein
MATLLAALGAQHLLLRQARAVAFDNAVARDSAEAAADTTRRTLLGDLTLAQRRLIQVSLQRDSLNHALRSRPVFHATTTATLPTVDTVLVAVPTRDSAQFTYDSMPYHAEVSVVLRPDTALARFRFRTDPMTWQVRADCGPAVRGIRPATLAYVTPSYLTVTIDSAHIVPLACHGDRTYAERHGWPYFVVRGAVAGSVVFAAVTMAQALGIIH